MRPLPASLELRTGAAGDGSLSSPFPQTRSRCWVAVSMLVGVERNQLADRLPSIPLDLDQVPIPLAIPPPADSGLDRASLGIVGAALGLFVVFLFSQAVGRGGGYTTLIGNTSFLMANFLAIGAAVR